VAFIEGVSFNMVKRDLVIPWGAVLLSKPELPPSGGGGGGETLPGRISAAA
jgi:hypothetical protein